MEIKLDDVMLKSVVSEAIFNSLDQQKRESLIQGAISFLLTKGENRYDRSSPIEQAFNDGVRSVAVRMATEMLADDEPLKAKIRELMNDALKLVMDTHREETVKKIADALAAGMAYKGDRY